jgi:hypothetical protein
MGGNWASPRPRTLPAGRAVSAWKVIKKHAPGRPQAGPGGDALVWCGLDETGQTRVTTVEQQAPVRIAQVVGVQIAYAEKDLQAAARAAGATWDAAPACGACPKKWPGRCG